MLGFVVVRLFLPLVYLAVSFWPDYGLAWIAWAALPSFPYAVSLVASVWAIGLSLLLPLPVRVFRLVSTVLVITSMIAVSLSAWSAGLLPPLTVQMGIIYAIVSSGVVLGWLMTSTRVWRFFHGIVAVDDQTV